MRTQRAASVLELRAFEHPRRDWLAWGKARIAAPEGSDWIELCDEGLGHHRAVALLGDRLVGCFYVGPEPVRPSAWLEGLFAQGRVAEDERARLLSGQAAAGAEGGPTICSCHGVGETDLRGAIDAGASTVDALCAATKAGTRCGSCIPELRALVELHTTRKG